MSDQITDRRAKLEKIRALGVDPFGQRFQGVTPHAEIRAAGETLAIEPGQISEEPAAAFRAAGRVVLYRDIGSLIFMTVRDRTGDLQFGLSKKMLAEGAEGPGGQGSLERGRTSALGPSDLRPPEPSRRAVDGATSWKVAKLLDLGDIVGIDGRLGRTKTGELTLWASHFSLLSKAVRPPPEKWHGLTDVEARYRRRYVDLFANPDSRAVFVTRARIIDYMREVLRRRRFIEVETPVLQPIYGGAAARPFVTHHHTLDLKLYLRISPELYLKRCLVGGLERVYEFARCFRNEGISPRHNPEFTMLELYQAYGDYHDMMDVCEELIGGAAREVIGSTSIATRRRDQEVRPEEAGLADDECLIDYATPWPRRKYAELVHEYAGVDIADRRGVYAQAKSIGTIARMRKDPRTADLFDAAGEPAADGVNVDHVVLVNELFEHFVEPHLVNPTFVIDYPAPLCPLTKRRPDDPNLALRFELFVNGTEIGNAYSELNDPDVQRANLAGQVAGEGDETMRVMDEDFCESLEYAMPPAGGLGIGIDRVVMLLSGCPSIRDVLLFPLQRPQG